MPWTGNVVLSHSELKQVLAQGKTHWKDLEDFDRIGDKFTSSEWLFQEVFPLDIIDGPQYEYACSNTMYVHV